MGEIRGWIIEWFSANTDLPAENIENLGGANYFEQKWIDSFGFINFISDIESKFGISFSNEEFQNRTFATINGLSEIIRDKTNV